MLCKQDTIENTSKELEKSTCGNNIRYHLGKISNFKELEIQLNLALKNNIPKGLKKKNLVIAIDLNLIPYYGKPKYTEKPYIYRSKAKDGTCSFYAYATLYTIRKCHPKNFGIETSYRLKNLCRIRTTTKKQNLRLLFVGISFLLVNIWVNLLWQKN